MTNINQILDIDFLTTSDESNWIGNTLLPPQTLNGKLRLVPDDSRSSFRREIGVLDSSNNRLSVKSYLEINRPSLSTQDKVNIIFGLYEGNSLLGQFSVCFENIGSGETVLYDFDRVYRYEGVLGSTSLRVSVTEGFENEIFLNTLNVFDFKQSDIRKSYFVVDGFFEYALSSEKSAFDLIEYKIDGEETLTNDFINDNQNNGTNPLNEWKLSRAQVNGENRVSNIEDPNTFNPFVVELGLDFDQVNSFFGGQAIGAVNGKDYGLGVLNIGVDKPAVINGNLVSKKGAFFIMIDYSKSLRVSFDVIINNNSPNVFNSPVLYRNYVIEWDPVNCVRQFYYIDRLINNNTVKIRVNEDGFLYGITQGERKELVLSCVDDLAFSGQSGVFEFDIEFGLDVGKAGITYDSVNLPDKFDIIWNDQTFSTGFVGSSQYDQQLLNLGISPSEINTGDANTSGQLLFDKLTPEPSKGKIRINAPLDGTTWQANGVCPFVPQLEPIQVVLGGCNDLISNGSNWEDVYVNSQDISGYTPKNGDVFYTDSNLTTLYNGSNQTFRVRIPKDGEIKNYTITIGVNGLVSNYANCPVNPPSGGNIVVNEFISDGCQSSWEYTVNVPNGETRQVETSFVPAPGGALILSTVGTLNINETTRFMVGIDGALGNPQFRQTSVVTIKVLNGANLLERQDLIRDHENANC